MKINSDSEKMPQLLKEAEGFEKQKKYSDAIDVYKEILELISKEKLIDSSSFVYKKIGLMYFYKKDYKTSKMFFKKSISEKENSKNAADSYFNLCLIYRKQKTKDSLVWSLNQSLKIYKTLDDNYDKFSTYSKAGILFKLNGQYDKAISYLLLAYDGFTKINKPSKKATVAGNIGDIQRLQGNLEVAKEYYKEHLNLQLLNYDSLKVSFAYNNVANLLYQMKRYDSAITKYRKALELQRLLGNKKNISKTLSNLGITYYKKEDFGKAEKYYKKALELKKQVKDSNAILQTLNELVFVGVKNEKFPSSFNYLTESNLYLGATIEKKVLLRNHEANTEYYSAIGNYKKGYESLKKYLHLNKQIFNKEQSQIIQTLQEQYESQLKEVKISNLTKENKVKSTTILLQKKRIQNRNLLISLFGLIILSLIGVFFYVRQRHKIKLQQEEYNKLKAILEGQETVKNHIAKDLHDIVLNSYEAVRLKVQLLSKVKDRKKMKENIIIDIERANSEVRLISHRLSPIDDIVKEIPLTQIIISRFTEFQHHNNIFIDIELPLPKVLDEMKLESKTNFYGVLLEILNNIRKHAKATTIFIKHSQSQKSLQFKFCDDGIGMVKKQKTGVGLLNIKQRIFLLGGKHTIHSDEKGSCISIEFPIKQNII